MARLKDQMNTMPEVVGRVITGFVFWPIVAVRMAIILFVLALWAINSPRMAARVLLSVPSAENAPDNKGTPKRRRDLQQLLDGLNDVRTRVSERKKQEPEPWRFRIYKIDGEYRRACSLSNKTTCD